jgi:hypothetical protein
MNRKQRILAVAAVAALAMVGTISLLAADRTGKNMPATPIDLFAGMQSGDLQVKFIPKNDRDASLVITNETKQPLSVKLPDAFVAAPILAQAGGGGVNRGATGGGRNNNTQNQTVGGGGGGGGFGGGGGGFNIAPEAVAKIKLPIVCLEHGKKDPAATVPYEIQPVESFTQDDRVKEVLTMLGNGNLDQRAAQAAAWHFSNGMSWDELANKRIHHLGSSTDEPYFSRAELQLALQIAGRAEMLAKDHPILASDKSSDVKTGSSTKDSAADPYSAAADSLTSTSTSSKKSATKK